MKRAILLIAVIALCIGQSFGPKIIKGPMPSTTISPGTPESLATNGLAYRWVATDISSNDPIATWPDRIQAHAFLNDDTTKRPTNAAASGVWISTVSWLTNAPLTTVMTNCSFGFILKMIDPYVANAIHPAIWAENEGGAVGIRCGLFLDYNDSHKAMWANLLDVTGPRFGSTTNVDLDMIISQVVTNGGDAWLKCWTNDIVSVEAEVSFAGNPNFVGSPSISPNTPTSLGRNSYRNTSPLMWIREIWVWTNAIPTASGDRDIPITVRSNFHYYATNTYGYSP